jgi:hypothetical protein
VRPAPRAHGLGGVERCEHQGHTGQCLQHRATVDELVVGDREPVMSRRVKDDFDPDPASRDFASIKLGEILLLEEAGRSRITDDPFQSRQRATASELAVALSP